jgi:hypothetical protein
MAEGHVEKSSTPRAIQGTDRGRTWEKRYPSSEYLMQTMYMPWYVSITQNSPTSPDSHGNLRMFELFLLLLAITTICVSEKRSLRSLSLPGHQL